MMEFLETIYQNVRISREKGDLSHFKGCLLAGVIRSKLILVQLDHPVSLTARYHILAKYCILTKTYTAKYHTLLNIIHCQVSHTAKYHCWNQDPTEAKKLEHVKRYISFKGGVWKGRLISALSKKNLIQLELRWNLVLTLIR